MGTGRPDVTEGRPLRPGEFADLFRGFARGADRLEAQRLYAIGEERADLDLWLAGSPRPPSGIGWWKGWLDRVAGLARQGKRVRRVRVVDEPPTDYQQWQLWAGPWHAAAGEEILYLPRSRAERIGLPLDHDWWILDDSRVIIMRYTEAGEPAGDELTDDPGTVAAYRAWRDLAVAHSTAAEQITAA